MARPPYHALQLIQTRAATLSLGRTVPLRSSLHSIPITTVTTATTSSASTLPVAGWELPTTTYVHAKRREAKFRVLPRPILVGQRTLHPHSDAKQRFYHGCITLTGKQAGAFDRRYSRRKILRAIAHIEDYEKLSFHWFNLLPGLSAIRKRVFALYYKGCFIIN